jgi:hypothetical protein
MRNYKDLRVWEEAHRLTLSVYKVTQTFPKEERFGLTSPDSTGICFDSREFGGRMRQTIRRGDGTIRPDCDGIRC